MGKGDLFWGGGMGLIWWGRGTYLIGEGSLFGGEWGPFFWWGMGALFLVGNGGPIRLGRGTT